MDAYPNTLGGFRMYSLARVVQKQRGRADSFIVVPDRLRGSSFTLACVQRLHPAGLTEGDCYISENKILYLDEVETALVCARMLHKLRAGWPRLNRTRNEKRGLQICEVIRNKNAATLKLVREFLRDVITQHTDDLFEKRRQRRRKAARWLEAEADRRFQSVVASASR